MFPRRVFPSSQDRRAYLAAGYTPSPAGRLFIRTVRGDLLPATDGRAAALQSLPQRRRQLSNRYPRPRFVVGLLVPIRRHSSGLPSVRRGVAAVRVWPLEPRTKEFHDERNLAAQAGNLTAQSRNTLRRIHNVAC